MTPASYLVPGEVQKRWWDKGPLCLRGNLRQEGQFFGQMHDFLVFSGRKPGGKGSTFPRAKAAKTPDTGRGAAERANTARGAHVQATRTKSWCPKWGGDRGQAGTSNDIAAWSCMESHVGGEIKGLREAFPPCLCQGGPQTSPRRSSAPEGGWVPT